MLTTSMPTLKTVAVLLLLLGLPSRAALAENFRVENKVFVANEKEPVAQSTTIFHEGVVYDFLEQPAETVVYDRQAECFTLLDMSRRLRTELPTRQVEAFSRQLQRSAVHHDDPLAQLLAAPTFDEKYDKTTGELTLSNPRLVYRLWLVDAGSQTIAQQYREFCDAYAQLNALLTPGASPPSARMLVNAALVKYEAFARKVDRTLTLKPGIRPKRLRSHSEHQFVRRMAQADLDRIIQTQELMRIYKPVTFAEYRKASRE